MFFRIFYELRKGEKPIHSFFRTLVFFVAIVSLHTAAMMRFEGMSLDDAVWLTLTSASTTGYGDLSASSFWGRASTIVFIYLIGITLLAKLAGDYISHLSDKREKIKMGDWDYAKKTGHIVIMNPPKEDRIRFLKTIKEQLDQEEETHGLDVVLVTNCLESEGLPRELREWFLIRGDYWEQETIIRSGVNGAKHVVILGEGNAESDGKALQAAIKVRDTGSKTHLISEYYDPQSIDLLKRNGVNGTIRQIRAYPELLTRAITAPGSESVFEQLFDTNGKSIRVIPFKGPKKCWGELFIEHFRLTGDILLGFDADGSASSIENIFINPSSDTVLPDNGRVKLFVLS